jgi:hypothetical protein
MDTVIEAWASDEAVNKSGGDGKMSIKGEGEGDREERTEGGRPFSGERVGGGAGRRVGAIQILKTREYKVTEE